MSSAIEQGKTQTSAHQPGAARKPPKALMKLLNPIMKAVLRSPLSGRMGSMLMILSYNERKSGKRYHTPVGYHWEGDTIFVYTHSPWWHNPGRCSSQNAG